MLHAGRISHRRKAVIDNQELDSRANTGAIYWEGLSDMYDAAMAAKWRRLPWK